MKIFNLKSTTAVVVANMIGTGVFTSLGFQLADLSSVYTIILLWCVGGVSSLAGALVYAELSAGIPRSGGEYNFLGRLYHPSLGFSAGFVSLFFGFAAPLALMSMALGEYMQHVIPLGSRTIAIGSILLVSAIHLVSVKTTANFQVYTTALKILLIFAFIFSGFVLSDSATINANLQLGNFKKEALSLPFAVGLAYVFFSYSGWNAATYFTDEIQEAKKTVKRALVFGVLIVASLYILLNFVFLLSTPVGSLKGQLDIGHVAATNIFGSQGGLLMSILISLALISSISSLILAGPRVAKVMGEDYSIFTKLSKANSKGTPVFAILAQVSIAIIFLLTASYESVLVYTGFVLNIFNLLTVAGLFIGEHKRLFRSSWFIKICATIFLLIYGWATIYLFSAKPKESTYGIITVLLGFVIYFLVKNPTNKHAKK